MQFPELSGTWALDLETYDPGLATYGPGWCFPNGNIIGVAVSWDAGREAEYYPVRHRGYEGGNLNPLEVFAWLEAQLAKPASEVVFHNRLYDAGWLRAEGVPFACQAHDTQVAAALIDEYRDRYSLDAVAKDYIGERKDERLLDAYAKARKWKGSTKNHLWRMPSDIVAPYARQDARATLRLWECLRGHLEAQKLGRVYALEMRLQPVLMEMRRQGIRVDEEQATTVKGQIQERERAIQKQMCSMAGARITSPWAPAPLAEACRKLDISITTTDGGAPSFTKEWLRRHPHPFIKLLAEWREVGKLRTTFIEGHVLGHAVNGRVHCEWHPLRKGDEDDDLGGTVTGRMSSSKPNLQQLTNPKRHPERYEEAKQLRKLFLPEPGEQYIAADYSQQEPRLLVHYADLCHLAGVSKVVDEYLANPATDFHRLLATHTHHVAPRGTPFDHWRAITKNYGLGMIYGMGGPKLCRSLGMPTKWVTKEGRNGTYQKEVAGDEGQQVMDTFINNAPYIKDMADLCQRQARQRGWIRTIGGRLCRFDRERGWHDPSLGGDSVHKALNRLIQGSAADQIKTAMCVLYEEHEIIPLVTVHDETGASGDQEKARVIKHTMETAVPLRIPSLVDCRLASSWGDTL